MDYDLNSVLIEQVTRFSYQFHLHGIHRETFQELKSLLTVLRAGTCCRRTVNSYTKKAVEERMKRDNA